MSTLAQQQERPGAASGGAAASERFRSLCAALQDYEHLPELTPGHGGSRTIGEQSQEDTLAESILAGLTQP